MPRMRPSSRPIRYSRICAVSAFALTLLLVLLPGDTLKAGAQWLRQWLPFMRDFGGAGGGHFDKVAHATSFGLCGFLLALGWLDQVRHWLLLYAILVVTGIGTEILQHFIPGRSADVWDAAFDAGGAAVGLGLGVWYWRRARALS